MDTRERRRSVLRELDRLESRGLLTYQVRPWPSEIELDESAPADVVSTVRQFERWSDDEDVSIRPPFYRRSYERSLTGESGEVLTLPGLVLAAYVDDELTTVVPYTRSGEHVTVDDYVSWLRVASQAAPAHRAEPAVAE